MPSLDKSPVPNSDFSLRLTHLKRRQQHTMWVCFAALSILALSTFAVFMQSEFIYRFWGLSQTVQQLHIPASVDLNALDSAQITDYFSRLLSWVGWLILKICVGFLGAFISIKILKRFHFFRIRLKSLVLKFVAWLISFILIWSLLSYVQYQQNQAVQQPYQALLNYDQNIQESSLAQYTVQAQLAPPVADYLLAQAALLHRPIDQAAASRYLHSLTQAEQRQADFISYGFKPEQLWSMQQQVYRKSMTPLAQQVDRQALKAQRVSSVVAWILYICMTFSALLAGISYLLAKQLQRRRLRIDSMLNEAEFINSGDKSTFY